MKKANKKGQFEPIHAISILVSFFMIKIKNSISIKNHNLLVVFIDCNCLFCFKKKNIKFEYARS